MLRLMLMRARARDVATLAQRSQIERALAGAFAKHLDTRALGYLEPAASHWRRAAEFERAEAGNELAKFWPDAVLSDSRSPLLPAEVHSVPAVVAASVAIEIQRQCDCEFSADLIYDTSHDQVASFVTRGCRGGVMSDLMFYFWFSPRYLVLPVFHTHPGVRSDLGLRMPSSADYGVMKSLQARLGDGAVGERVYFPDGSCTEYGVTGAGHYYFRRPVGCAYLFSLL